jgi:three-Cys-motif partner protein
LSEYTKHNFGGPWTTEKLDILSNYINAYTTALKGLPFKKIYIDAFAGTGYRTPKSRVTPEADLFQDEPLDIDEKFLSGSARIALQATHPFDEYIFIEKNSRRCRGLTALREEFPHLADRISIRKADANTVIAEVCAELKSNSRALLFIDPYGMDVNWKTIEVIAGTRKIDVWYLC